LSCLILAHLAGTACGGSGGGGGNLPIPLCLQLQAGVPSAGSIALAPGTGSTCEVVVVDVLLTDIDDVFAIEFTLSYDPAIAQYDSVSIAGSALDDDGTSLEILQHEAAGQVTVALTRLGATGIDVTAGRAVSVLFSAAGTAGMTGVVFSDESVFGSERPPLEKTGLSWIGGTLTLQ
jgi:hypothetical protein